MSFWQKILVGALIVIGAAFGGIFYGKGTQRAKDEMIWAQTPAKVDSITKHDTAVVVTPQFIYVEKIVAKHDTLYYPANVAILDTVVGSAKDTVHTEYWPPPKDAFLNTRIGLGPREVSMQTYYQTKTIMQKAEFWEKPLAIIGGGVAGWGAAKGKGALAAVGGAVALISVAIDF